MPSIHVSQTIDACRYDNPITKIATVGIPAQESDGSDTVGNTHVEARSVSNRIPVADGTVGPLSPDAGIVVLVD